MPDQPYAKLIAVKRWADRGLYDAVSRNVERLNGEDAVLMLRILDHMHVVDQIFRHHLQRLPHAFQAPRSQKLPELQALARGAAEVDDWYVSYVDGLSERELDEPYEFAFTSGKAARMTRGEMILHVCMHGAYHRGNAGALLQLRGLTPSRDAVTDFLEDTA